MGEQCDRGIGMIPLKALKEGIRLCTKNVEQLLKDASVLYGTESYGHAQALAIFAMEEYAKKIVLVARKMHPDRFEHEMKRAFWDHDLKLQLALNMLIKEFPDAPSNNQIASVVVDLASRLSSLKQVSLYVDYDKDLGWFDPNKRYYENVAAAQIRYARELVTKVDPWLEKI
jgi:AbiV family abortive infection protein